MSLDSAIAQLSAINLSLSFEDTADKQYDKLQRYINVSSYSMLETLHDCPRRFQLIKAAAASGSGQRANVDTAFGHAVGAGIQSYAATGSLETALLNAFLAWRIPFEAAIEKKNKTIWDTWLAVMKYVEFASMAFEDWEVWTLPSGKPAIELAVEVDFENGYKHYMHIDAILHNRRSGEFAVQENKTTGFREVEEAIYANSSQGLGYAVLLDMLADATSIEVFYVVYSTTTREWHLVPFTKSASMKAEWITEVRLDHAAISTYRKLNFFPKMGNRCFDFMRRCQYFGECNMTEHLPAAMELPAEKSAEKVDFSFKVSEIIAKQQERNAA